MTQAVHIFGIRHHGPGGAKALRDNLASLEPDIILVEGPPEADELLPLAIHANMAPPVALLLYDPANPQTASFFPFAVFSPEWQAINYGLKRQIPVRFMDLPMAHRLAMRSKPTDPAKKPGETEDSPAPIPQGPDPAVPGNEVEEEKAPTTDTSSPSETSDHPDPVLDPFGYLGRAAGYSDGERFWEHLVEQRTDRRDVFQAVMEAMALLRSETPTVSGAGADSEKTERDQMEARREAYMRKILRGVMKEGFGKIAVVCGAWHAPVLVPGSMPTATADNKTLADMPKIKVAAAWVPWTYGRLTSASGYGAGVDSPGWYHHLFHQENGTGADHGTVIISWFARIARCLREKDLDCSSAHIIEATRLAQTLATIRGRVLPGLEEIEEAILGVLTFGESAPLALIRENLHIGSTMGTVPAEGPIPPLQVDFQKQQKRLRLPAEAAQKMIELDLRKTMDLERSQLLHRMDILSIPWGKSAQGLGGRTRGTFKEPWQIQWQPDFAIALIEAGVLGTTVYDAATNLTRQNAIRSKELPQVIELLDKALLAELPEAIRFLIHRVETLAAVATDLQLLMKSLPTLTNILRYGNVRKTDSKLIEQVVQSLATRITIGLPLSLLSLNDEAASQWDSLLAPTHGAFELIGSIQGESSENGLWDEWMRSLDKMASQSTIHGLLAGHMTRICLDSGQIKPLEVEKRMSLALSQGADPAHGAHWVEGFLKGSGLVLLHNQNLWDIVDRWVGTLTPEAFVHALPLLRRTFSLFATGERRQMGQRVKEGNQGGTTRSVIHQGFDETRASRVIPILEAILGSGKPSANPA